MPNTLDRRYKQALLSRAIAEVEAHPDFVLPVHMDMTVLQCVVGCLQLSLRHPANTGPSAQIVRKLVDGIIGRVEAEGYLAVGEMLRCGDNPELDE